MFGRIWEMSLKTWQAYWGDGGHVYLFLDFLTRSAVHMSAPKTGRLRDFYIKEALTYMEQNFQNDISVEDIASTCGDRKSTRLNSSH